MDHVPPVPGHRVRSLCYQYCSTGHYSLTGQQDLTGEQADRTAGCGKVNFRRAAK
jgi:hypothetical protein